MAPAAVEAKLKELTSSVVPDAENSFIMYGETPAVANLIEKQTTTVTVTVTRIAAKLKEETATASWDVTKPATNDNALDKTVKVNFKGYAFTNLTSASNIVEQSDKKVTEFIETSVFTGEFKAFEYLPMNAVADDAQITYCFENYNADVNRLTAQALPLSFTKPRLLLTASTTPKLSRMPMYMFGTIPYIHSQD